MEGVDGSAPGDASATRTPHGNISFESSQAWTTSLSPALPSMFTDVEEVDVFARPRMLSFVRRYRTQDKEGGSSGSGSVAASPNDFSTKEIGSGGVFHAALRVPVTPAAARFVDADSNPETPLTAVWAHGVSNTVKDAELLAAMHAERMADLLGYHLYSLPSRQRKHAKAARTAGRYASSPDDTGSGPSSHERRAQWPLPLRRILSDEETEGGRWQLVDTSASARRFLAPPHTLLSPCLLDERARDRIEARFAAAPTGCPVFAQQLSVETVRTMTASSSADGGAPFVVACLTLPAALTSLPTAVVASGKATDRATAVALACMHAELLLDALHVPLFSDPATQQLHSVAALSYGRPAPLAGAKVRNPSHVHLPDPLKQLVVSSASGQRTAMRSAEEDYFHHHDILTEQTGSFLETSVGEATALAVLERFLEDHNAPRASAAFLQTPVGNRVRSTVLLPLPESYGIRGGVGVAARPHDANILAAMHALDVLCMLGIPVTSGTSERAAVADAAWKAARREQILDVPATVTDAAAPSPPARRCSAKAFDSMVSVVANSTTAASSPLATAQGDAAASSAAGTAAPVARRRVVKRAKLASDAAAGQEAAETATASPAGAAAAAVTTPTTSTTQEVSPAKTPQGEREEAEAQLAETRKEVDAEFWDLKADSPDGYIMIAPGAQHDTAMDAYAIASPRRLDKQAKQRVTQYLATVGRRLDDVRVKQTLTEEETEGRQRRRCVLKLPLPSVCGDPRLAMGEADNAADAEHAACMHAELLLDALGVCIYVDAVHQQRHAQTCAQWGRWAPPGPGHERPSTTPSPPPLRREHAGSLHWERRRLRPAQQKNASATALPEPADVDDELEDDDEVGDAAAAATPTDGAVYEYISAENIDSLARSRVSYYLRFERLATPAVRFTEDVGVSDIRHIAAVALPIAPRYTQSRGEENEPAAAASASSALTIDPLTYTVQGVAATRRDAELLAWMHAERLLDALRIPLFPNLPQLQAYHAAQVAKEGRRAPKGTRGPSKPLTPLETLPVKPLQVTSFARHVDVPRPTPPSLVEAASPVQWERYVAACESYITARLFSASETFFEEQRSPRTGDTVIDAAMAEAEAAPLKPLALRLLNTYSLLATGLEVRGWSLRGIGATTQRIYLATAPLPGFEYVQMRGVGFARRDARLRAAMHGLALYRRIDSDYANRYAAAKANVQESASFPPGDQAKNSGLEEEEDFDLDTFSTLPSISSEARYIGEGRTRSFKERLSRLFIEDTARVKSHADYTDAGKKRAIEMYVQCCGLAPLQVRELVRLLPRAETAATAPSAKSPELELEVTVQLDVEDPDAQRVECGAVFTTELAVTDEDGREVVARHTSSCRSENLQAAYDKLFAKLAEQVPAMKRVLEVLSKFPFMRAEEVPAVELPAEVTARVQACLRNQKDLLQAESETGSWSSEAVEELVQKRYSKRQSETLRKISGITSSTPSLPGGEAAESAEQLERLQQRITDPTYLAKYAVKRANLTIAEHKADILRAVRDNPVVIICGTTGCGKTTQVPQYIFDDMIQQGRGGACRIAVSQPRRIGATSIARRVAEERMEAIGDSVGYTVRFDSKPGRHIAFATTGVLLRWMRNPHGLDDFTHIIIDEIHERDLLTDFLLVLMRDLIEKRPDLRVILMSATLQASDFQRYFNGAPLIRVLGRTFPVKDYFLEDLVPFAREHQYMTPLLKEAESVMKHHANGGFGSSAAAGEPANAVAATPLLLNMKALADDSGSATGGVERMRYNTLPVSSPLDFPTVHFAVEQAVRLMDLKDSSILVFLPGWHELSAMQTLLERNPIFHVVLLHSTLAPDAQSRVFLPAPPGKVKVILSTNIAESGVTIDDVGVVIDTGRSKEKTYARRAKRFVPRTMSDGYDNYVYEDSTKKEDNAMGTVEAHSRYTYLANTYASRANCVQRRGRVGRTRPGICIRLYSRQHFDCLHEFQTPQMLSSPLDSLCLQILGLGLGSPSEFLKRALEPPQEADVDETMRRLTNLGAVGLDGSLTPLGFRLSLLPVDPSSGKLILLGAAFGCLDSALTIAAGMEVDLFSTAMEDRKVVRIHRESLSANTRSDQIASVNAFNFWAVAKLSYPPAQLAQELNDRLLRVPRLLQVSHMKRNYCQELLDADFIEGQDAFRQLSPEQWQLRSAHIYVDESACSRNAQDVGLVKAILAAALFPNVALIVGPGAMRTAFDSYVLVSNSSVLHRPKSTPTGMPYVVFSDLGRFNNIMTLKADNSTVIPFWALFLFGGRALEMEYVHDMGLCVMDGWLYFRVSLGTLELMRKFKALLDRRLNRKFIAPHDKVNNAQLEVLGGIVSTLMRMPLRPYPALHRDVVWRETGTIIAPRVGGGSNRFIGDVGSPLEE